MKKLLLGLLALTSLTLTGCANEKDTSKEYNVLDYQILTIYSYGDKLDEWLDPDATAYPIYSTGYSRDLNYHNKLKLTILSDKEFLISGTYTYPYGSTTKTQAYDISFYGDGYSYILKK